MNTKKFMSNSCLKLSNLPIAMLLNSIVRTVFSSYSETIDFPLVANLL